MRFHYNAKTAFPDFALYFKALNLDNSLSIKHQAQLENTGSSPVYLLPCESRVYYYYKFNNFLNYKHFCVNKKISLKTIYKKVY
jgi:hypothetical protein